MEMVKRGEDTIVLALCITRGNPIGFKCPHANEISQVLHNKLGENVTIIEYTH